MLLRQVNIKEEKKKRAHIHDRRENEKKKKMFKQFAFSINGLIKEKK